MPTDVTETLSFPSTIAVPVGGDARTAASVATPFERLARRTRVLLNAIAGHLIWSGRLRSGTPVSGTGVFADEIVSVVIGEAYLVGNATYEVPGALSAVAAWRYVYAYNNAGVLALQHSLDAPDASLTWKSTGVGTHRYLGCFRTDAAGAVMPFRATRGRYLYRRSAMLGVAADLASDGLRALNDTGASAAALVDLTPVLPPHARAAIINAEIAAVATGSDGYAILNLYTSDETAAASQRLRANVDATGNESTVSTLAEIEVTADADLAIGYGVVLSGATAAYTIDVLGWQE
ncbi:MAG: hypothetical protein Q8S73_37865 [Deltaproteobacteria bacterium]|nr:hypothetical protein [Myxococcales bacterium]MDP3219929.1 hypothetical protein [Deltaproteobacteria bacterium]